MSNANRNKRSGQYESNMSKPCVCGDHEHTAAVTIVDGKKYRPCIQSDFDPTISCDCTCYRPSRSKKLAPAT